MGGGILLRLTYIANCWRRRSRPGQDVSSGFVLICIHDCMQSEICNDSLVAIVYILLLAAMFITQFQLCTMQPAVRAFRRWWGAKQIFKVTEYWSHNMSLCERKCCPLPTRDINISLFTMPCLKPAVLPSSCCKYVNAAVFSFQGFNNDSTFLLLWRLFCLCFVDLNAVSCDYWDPTKPSCHSREIIPTPLALPSCFMELKAATQSL